MSNPQGAASHPPGRKPARPASARALAALFLAAVVLRAVIGAWADGRGEMEGLAWRYRADAYAIAAGYGMLRPAEHHAPQVDLLRLADSLRAEGRRISPATAPPIDRARWRASTLHPPGYAFLLAGIYRVFGEPLHLWARWLQILFDAAACLLLYDLGRRLAGPRVGLFAAACAALFPPTAYLVTSRVADSLMPGALIGVTWLYVRGLQSAALRWYALAGLALGVACLFRPDYLLLPAFLAVGVLAARERRRRHVLGVALLGALAVAVLVPWGLRNLRAHGTFNLATHAGGMTLLESVGQFPNPYGIVFDDDLMDRMAVEQGFEGIDDPRADRYFKQRFLDIVRRDPGLIVGQMLRRIPLGIAPLYRWGYDNPHYRGHSFYDYVAREQLGPLAALRRHPAEILAAYWDRMIFGVVSLILMAGSIAAFFAGRNGWRVALLMLLPYLYLFLSHLPIVLGARLLLPAVFGQFVAAGLCLEAWRRRQPPAWDGGVVRNDR